MGKRKYARDDVAYSPNAGKRKRGRFTAATGQHSEALSADHTPWGSLSGVPLAPVSTPAALKAHCEQQLAGKWAERHQSCGISSAQEGMKWQQLCLALLYAVAS